MGAVEAFEEKSDTVSVLGAKAIYALSAPSTPQKTRDDIVARLEQGEKLTSQMVEAEVKAAQKKAKAIAASSAPEAQGGGPKPDEAAAPQPTGQGRPDQAQPADAATPARCAADLLLEHFKHDWDELAGFLDDANPHELLKHLRRGCAARKRQAA